MSMTPHTQLKEDELVVRMQNLALAVGLRGAITHTNADRELDQDVAAILKEAASRIATETTEPDAAQNEWQELVQPLVQKCEVAWKFGQQATWNATGAEALGKLLKEMAEKLDCAAAQSSPSVQSIRAEALEEEPSEEFIRAIDRAMSAKEHILKTVATAWDAIESGQKRFEVRRNDRFFQGGDIVVLRRLDDSGYYSTGKEGRFSTKDLRFKIGWILQGGQFGIEPGYIVFQLEPTHDS